MVLDCEWESTWIWTLTKGPICMTEFFKKFEPFCMNFRKFRNHIYECCRFEDARSIQFSLLVIKILKKATLLPELRLKTDPYKGNFRWKAHPYERHVQYNLTIKYSPPPAKLIYERVWRNTWITSNGMEGVAFDLKYFTGSQQKTASVGVVSHISCWRIFLQN